MNADNHSAYLESTTDVHLRPGGPDRQGGQDRQRRRARRPTSTTTTPTSSRQTVDGSPRTSATTATGCRPRPPAGRNLLHLRPVRPAGVRRHRRPDRLTEHLRRLRPRHRVPAAGRDRRDEVDEVHLRPAGPHRVQDQRRQDDDYRYLGLSDEGPRRRGRRQAHQVLPSTARGASACLRSSTTTTGRPRTRTTATTPTPTSRRSPTRSGNTKATYGYTAYGSDDKSEFTGIDKPDASRPDQGGLQLLPLQRPAVGLQDPAPTTWASATTTRRLEPLHHPGHVQRGSRRPGTRQ